MVKLLLSLALATAAFGAPTPKPSVTPKPTPAATAAPTPRQLQVSAQADATTVADQIVGEANSFVVAASFIENGMPARGNKPAITAAAIQSALGADNVAKIRAAANALK